MSVCAECVVETIQLVHHVPVKPAYYVGEGATGEAREPVARAVFSWFDRWYAVLLPTSLLLNALTLFGAIEAWTWIRS